ncbi:uncharacterized protein HHUB_2213 [Halobacterium hubeiense]|uniref:Uncharacterized protein n=1 Tax=Halobacterium hubeiense TaxID=1407499 RepID=A0A0U5H2Q3_9EURY|nr:uncharacterized protein HHUB_2213 [Halobacterium hubeiense]
MSSEQPPQDDADDEPLLDRLATLSALLTNIEELLSRHRVYFLLPTPEMDPRLTGLVVLGLLLKYILQNRKDRSAE